MYVYIYYIMYIFTYDIEILRMSGSQDVTYDVLWRLTQYWPPGPATARSVQGQKW